MKKNNKTLRLLLVLALCSFLLCSCFFFPKDENPGGDPSGDTGDVDNPDNSGDTGTPDDPNEPDDPEKTNNPDEPNESDEPIVDPDAGKNGIEEILTAFSDILINEESVDDAVISSSVQAYTFNSLDAENSDNPVALYVINHGEERVGTDSDVSIIRDLLDEYIVVVLDYQNAEKAVSPYLEESANNHKIDIMKSGAYLSGISFNANETYLLPAGYRIVRNIEFFNIMEHAPKGVVNKIIDVWNNQSQIKDKIGDAWTEAASLDDIVMKNGESLTAKDDGGNYKYLTYHMDIIYPSNPEGDIPGIMYASTGAIRNTAMVSANNPDRFQYAGFLFGGYCLTSFDHDYFPFMKDEAGWGHIEPNYSLQSYMGTRFMTAALRCVKYYSDELGYSDENIGIYGHSKSSWVALFKQASLATVDPEELEEVYTYGGFEKGECFGEQPFKTYKDGTKITSDVKCVYHSMGNGTNDCRYLATDNIPQMVGVGEDCQYNSWTKFFKSPNVYKTMDLSGCNWVPVIMYNVGHTYPKNMSDEMYGYNYYLAFRSFFDYHLKGASAVILHTSVKANGEITEDEEIFIQFNAVVDASGALKLLDASGNAVEGEWIAARGGNQWKFIPAEPLTVGEKYTIVADSTIKDTNSNTVSGIEVEFTYAEGVKDIVSEFNSSIFGSIVEDTYVASNSSTAKNADYSTSKTTLGTYSEYYRAYFKFNFNDILESEDFEIFKENGKIQFSFSVAKGFTNITDTTKFTFGGFVSDEGVSDVAFSEVYWNNLTTTGAHNALHWGSATNLVSSELPGENIAYYSDMILLTFDYAQIADFIDPATGDAVFVLRIVGTSGISIASMENDDFAAPAVSFVYNK